MVSSALEAGHETGEVTRAIDQAQFLHRALSFGVPIETSQNYRLSTEREWLEGRESVLPNIQLSSLDSARECRFVERTSSLRALLLPLNPHVDLYRDSDSFYKPGVILSPIFILRKIQLRRN